MKLHTKFCTAEVSFISDTVLQGISNSALKTTWMTTVGKTLKVIIAYAMQ